MDFGKAMGVLILCAVVMAIFFFLVRRDVKKEVSEEKFGITYFVCYLVFTGIFWGIIMAIWFGIHLIVG